LVGTILARAGYQTCEAATGEDAVEFAERERPEVVVLDIHLPGISGHEVCRQLGRDGERPPVLFVSGERIEPHDRVAGLLVGGDDYLVKPFAPGELLARIHALIRRARETRSSLLTSDERELVQLLRQGFGAGEAAEQLGQPKTAVRDRIDDVFKKLGV
jgi:DNA-binding response OmpR family regulator